MNPAASGYFVARVSLGTLGDITEKYVMMLLRSTILKQVLRRFARQACFLFEFPKGGVRQMLSAFEDPSRQSPFRLTSCNQQNSLASTTDNSGSFPQARSNDSFLV